MSFRRIPKEIDPRRPPKQRERKEGEGAEPRSYGQYVEMTPEELAELERATGEVAREPSAAEGIAPASADERARRKAIEAREEFEEITDEVSRENGPR